MVLRVMTVNDYEGVYQLWLDTPGMGLNNIDDSKAGIEKYLLRNPRTCFVAEEGNKIIGVIISGHDGRRGFIYHLAVSIEKRKNKIGKDLVDAAMQVLEKKGINKVALVAFSSNSIGNVFWEKQGFVVRDDLIYRNKSIRNLKKIVTD